MLELRKEILSLRLVTDGEHLDFVCRLGSGNQYVIFVMGFDSSLEQQTAEGFI